MKSYSNILMTVVFIISVMSFLSETSFAQETHDKAEADEQAIRFLEEQERMGVLNQDFHALEQIWSEHFMVNSPRNQVAPNRSVVLDIFRQGLAHYTSFERSIEYIRIDGDIAIVMGAETVQPTGNAPLAGETVHRRYTNFWKRDGEMWSLVARHANNIITD
jgi:hypothetical protein